jgi:hypothetical protein
MAYDLDAIRRKLKQSMTGKFNDPDEFKPEKAKSSNDPLRYRFFVMPPVFVGDTTKQGEVKKGMDQFYVQHGNHWVNERPNACPRAYDNSDCPICSFGFDLLKTTKDLERRTAILRQWMPATYYMVNIYFPNIKTNPEDLRGRVMFYNAPKSCCDMWVNAILRDGSGDADDPQAHGAFFDENAGFMYELQVLKNGRQNGYKTSKFVVGDGNPVPFLKNDDGKPDKAGLLKLLEQRHDLWLKIEKPDEDKIKKIASVMIDGDDAPDDSRISTKVEEDDDLPLIVPTSKAAKPEAKSEIKVESKVQQPKKQPVIVDDDDEGSEIENLLKNLPDDDD